MGLGVRTDLRFRGFRSGAPAPLQCLVDAATALVLFAVLGFRWTLLVALAAEAVPGLQLFPAWTLSVAALAGMDASKPAVVKQELTD